MIPSSGGHTAGQPPSSLRCRKAPAAELLEEAGVAGISVEFSVPKYLGTGISPFITHSPLRGASFSRSLVAARDLTTPLTTDPFLTSEGLSAEAPFKPKQLVNTHSLAAAKEEEAKDNPEKGHGVWLSRGIGVCPRDPQYIAPAHQSQPASPSPPYQKTLG